MMLKIGTRSTPTALWQAEYTRNVLQSIGVESAIVPVDHPGEALLRGDIDMTAYALDTLPIHQPDGIVITAVSERANPADVLLIRPEAVDKRQDFGLKQGATVGTTAGRIAQMRDFRPDVVLQNLNEEDAPACLEDLRKGAYDAVLVSATAILQQNLDVSSLEVLELNPREFVPRPAQGVLAWQTHRDDLPTRRILKQLHHPDVAACTNVERRVLQLVGDASQPSLGVFVERDAAGNFHAFAACETAGAFRRVRLSQSTNFELAERVVERLR